MEQHSALNERHVSKSSQGNPVGPSHLETKSEEGEQEEQKKTQNQEDSEPE